ncbi:hypothetical protein AB4090_05430 [Acidithiobacillus sp. IBUN Pt1247-S3]|uniref:hypothetical protein n=1 Tax=Acidithiobacillus sp. IBUN Pt1247-S3 TaxID=3166642 RepID=UPI0034E3A6C0
MSIEDRFRQFHAPASFSPKLGIPLEWGFREDHPDWLAVFDPQARRGLVFHLQADDPKELDAGFHLDGRVARLVWQDRLIFRLDDQERVLQEVANGTVG